MAADFISLLAPLGGSLLGGIGAIAGKYIDNKQKNKELEIELKLTAQNHAHELSMAQLGNSAKLEQLAVEQQSAVLQGEYEAFKTSIESDRATYSIGTNSKLLEWADFIRGTMRPALTGALLVYMGLSILLLVFKYDVELTNPQLYDLLYLNLTCLATGANLALTWWFGSRQLTKFGG